MSYLRGVIMPGLSFCTKSCHEIPSGWRSGTLVANVRPGQEKRKDCKFIMGTRPKKS